MASKEYDHRPQIEVKGEVEILLPAERAILNVKVSMTGPEKAATAQAVIESAKQVELLLRSITTKTDGQKPAADYWSRTSLYESNYQPYDNVTRTQLAREYTAKIEYSVNVQKFERLGPIIHDMTAIKHVSSEGVSWVLTPGTIENQRSTLRTRAAKSAMTKANDYAEASGFTKIVAIELKEATHYVQSSNRKGGGSHVVAADPLGTAAKNMAELDWEDVGEEVFQYTPEEVKMSQTVNGRFAAE